MTYWKTPEFQALQQAWYSKLEADGFEDAEILVGGEMHLRQSAAHPLRHEESELGTQSRMDYFRLMAEKYREAQFDSKTDRIILLLRSNGAKICQILQTLDFLGKTRCRETVRCKIRKYEVEWGVRRIPRKLPKSA